MWRNLGTLDRKQIGDYSDSWHFPTSAVDDPNHLDDFLVTIDSVPLDTL